MFVTTAASTSPPPIDGRGARDLGRRRARPRAAASGVSSALISALLRRVQVTRAVRVEDEPEPEARDAEQRELGRGGGATPQATTAR